MKVVVRLIRDRGRDLSHGEASRTASYRGNLRVSEARSTRLGRTALTADLISLTEGTETPVLPPLRDATLLFLIDGRMRIAGIELIESVQYAQTWDVKVQS